LESLKTLFKEERDRSFERFKVELAGIQEKIEEVNGRVDGISDMVEVKIDEAMSSVDGSVREIETSYLKTGNELKDRVQNSIDGINSEVEEIRVKVDDMKENVVKDVSDTLGYFRIDVEKEIEESRELIYEKGRELQELVTSLAGGAKADLEASHGEAEKTLRGFEIEVAEVQGRIEKRVGDIERRIREFEKESTVLKRAIRFKDIMMQLKEDKKDILSMRKVIDNLKRDEGDISAKVRQLKSEKKLVQDIAKNAEQAIGLITVVDEKIKLIEGERELLEREGAS
jgi:hypothetical protein